MTETLDSQSNLFQALELVVQTNSDPNQMTQEQADQLKTIACRHVFGHDLDDTTRSRLLVFDGYISGIHKVLVSGDYYTYYSGCCSKGDNHQVFELILPGSYDPSTYKPNSRVVLIALDGKILHIVVPSSEK